MRKHTKLFAALSTAGVLALAAFPASVSYAGSYGWSEEDGTLVYYDEDGYKTTDSWRKKGEDWYYLDEDGFPASQKKIDDYYVGDDGRMVRDSWVQLRNEEELDSPETPASYWYYFDKDGKAAASRWVKLDSKWYYFNDAGQMQTGKTAIDGSTYYLGENGAMKTGWVQLPDTAANPGASESWYYFNADGTMTETQYDKKIDGSYYTFLDGKMQTGWVEMPAADGAALAEDSASQAADGAALATDSDAGNGAAQADAFPSISRYQYYGPDGDGKRAEGFRTIPGIRGIHSMEETYTFYFKAGKPFFSAKKGNQLFTVSGKKFAFSETGVMQTGRKVVNLENGEIANFFFGEDGAMATGKQNIYNAETGETESWFFHADGAKKGQGYHGLRDNVLYVYGKRQEATAGERYAPAELNGVTYLVNTTGNVQKASASSTSTEKPELGRGFKDYKDANGKVWVVDKEGMIR